MALFCGLFLVSCSEKDAPAVEPVAVDNGVWIVSDSDADPTVRAGDDFFMHCNGNWWKTTDLGDEERTGFLRTTVQNALNEKVAALDLPSLPILKHHAVNFALDKGEDAKAFEELLRPVMEATTLEQAWLETGRMMARGGTIGYIFQPVSIEGKVYYAITMDFSLAHTSLSDNQNWWQHDIRYDPDRQARLVPITGGTIPGQGLTRSIDSGGEWPMLVAWYEGIGINPAFGLTDAEYSKSQTGVDMDGLFTEDFRKAQEMDLETYKEYIRFSVQRAMERLLSGEKDKLADNIYKALARYESSRAMSEKYVTEDMRQRTLDISNRLRATFANRISRSPWLCEASKAAALDKLNNMTFNVGGPKTWFSEGFADLSASKSLVEDVQLLMQARMNVLKKIAGQSVSENAFTLLTIIGGSLIELNSAYMTGYNAMFIYPIFMMEPFCPQDANEAFIYAGAQMIGHEITHGFDASGYKFNKYGGYGPIFSSEEDMAQFTALTQRLTDWYSRLEVMPDELPGLCNKGDYTLGENIADLGGFEIAFEAYTNKLKEDGFQGEGLRLQQQRFYQASAYIWKTKYTAAYAQRRTIGSGEYAAGIDNHSLEKERVNGVVANTDAWYELFDVRPGDKMYLSPEERIHIW